MFRRNAIKPPEGSGLNRSHSLSSGLYWFVPFFNRGAGSHHNLITGQALPKLTSEAPTIGSPFGEVIRFGGTQDLFQSAIAPTYGGIPFSVAFVGRPNGGDNTSKGIFAFRLAANSLTNRTGFFTDASSKVQFSNTHASAAAITEGTAAGVDRFNSYFGVTRSATDHQLFKNGILEGSSSTDVGAVTARDQIVVGQPGGALRCSFDLLWIGAWLRPILLSEAQDVADDPLILFRQARSWVPVSIGPNIFSYSGSGGIQFAGAATTSIVRHIYVYTPSGGVQFAGAATTSFVAAGPRTYTYTPSGGIQFGGAATTLPVGSLTPTQFAETKTVFQRAAGTMSKSVTFAGAYSGTTPSSVEIQVLNGGATVIDWTALSGLTAVGGNISGALQVTETASFCTWKMRTKTSTGQVMVTSAEQTNSFGVGVLLFCIGQSNMRNMDTISDSPVAADARISFHKSNAWTTSTGNGARMMANKLAETYGGVIGCLFYAVGGTAISTWDAPGDTNYDNAVAGLDDAGGDCEFILWHQGENDAIAGTTKAAYKTALGTLYSNLLSHTGRTSATLKFGVSLLGNIDDPTANDATTDPIRQAQLEFIRETTGAFFLGSSVDMVRSDAYHWQTAGAGEIYYERMARRFDQGILKQMGLATYGAEGPEIVSATVHVGSPTIKLRIRHNGGTALVEADGSTDGSGVTGFRVFRNSIAETIATTRFVGADMEIDMSANYVAGETITFDHQYGENPSITKVVYDNQTPQGDTLGFPLQPTIGAIIATLAGGYMDLRRRRR